MFKTFTVSVWLLLIVLCCVTGSSVLYPWGATSGDSFACLDAQNNQLDNPFKLTTTRGLPFFGNNYRDIYVSPNGFISDIAADGLVTNLPKRFPMNVSGSSWTSCNNTADPDCWLAYYYDPSVAASIIAGQADSDVCVHGRNVTAFDTYDNSHWQDAGMGSYGTDYNFITDPAGCVMDTYPSENFPNWIVSVYWMELDAVAQPASLTFRETDETAVLNQAKADVESLASVTSFSPQWAFVFTWNSVTYVEGWKYKNTPLNTFQLVAVTDGRDTYAIYNYEQTTFAGGTIGFDSGDGRNFCSFSGSRVIDIKNVTSSSNIGKPGRWVLKLGTDFDNSTCEPPRTNVPSCICEPGWEGVLCSKSINDCISNPCQSGYTCQDGHMSYTCVPEPVAVTSPEGFATWKIIVIAVCSALGLALLIIVPVCIAKHMSKTKTLTIQAWKT